VQHKQNSLLAFRLRLNISQREVARLLGHGSTKMVSKLERGNATPSLTTALKLSAILRAPVEFLFPELYSELRQRIRQLESQKVEHIQQLPLERMPS
jgi:transcriptional regulator with XRE-family HTH domain